MARLASTLRRVRRQIQSKAAVFIVGSFVIFALIALLNTNYTPPAVHPVHIDLPLPTTKLRKDGVNGPRRAYVQYVASPEDLCKAVMIFSELHESFSSALRVLYYPSDWRLDTIANEGGDMRTQSIARLLKEATAEFSVILKPTDILLDKSTHKVFAGPFQKFLAFNLTQYDQVIVLDTDSIVYKSTDELFELPPAPLALPYVFWGDSNSWQLSTKLMLIRPSPTDFIRVENAVKKLKNVKDDKDLVVELFNDTLLRLPQRPYHLLSEEFRRQSHIAYLGIEKEAWNPGAILREAKFVHFWDPALQQGPWATPQGQIQRYLPRCAYYNVRRRKKLECGNRDAWMRLYNEFSNRRRIVCGAGFN
jgi:hypothetical protein